MIDILLALLLGVLPIDPIRPAPALVAPEGTVRTIPDPLPYVLDELYWGAR
jgi:hypothetical protein